MKEKKYALHLDLIGMASSLLCAIHCIALPVALTVGAMSGLFWLGSPLLEWFFLATSVVVASLSLVQSYVQKHHQSQALWIAGAGFTLLVLSRFAAGASEHFLTAYGGVLIATAHYSNWRLLQQNPLSMNWKLWKPFVILLALLCFLSIESTCNHKQAPKSRAAILESVWYAK